MSLNVVCQWKKKDRNCNNHPNNYEQATLSHSK